MRVTPITSSVILDVPISLVETPAGQDLLEARRGGVVSEIDQIAEFAGRSCYESYSKPNAKTATNRGYMNNIIKQGHFSVMEHNVVGFYVEGVSRSLTHELIRHRHLQYSELSQRYVDIEDANFVTPPALRDLLPNERKVVQALPKAVEAYNDVIKMLGNKGARRKQAREAARAYMPGGTETKIIVSGNLRAWRDFLKKRWHVAADAEIREFAGAVLEHLRIIAPNSVQDIPETPYTNEYDKAQAFLEAARDPELLEAFRHEVGYNFATIISDEEVAGGLEAIGRVLASR